MNKSFMNKSFESLSKKQQIMLIVGTFVVTFGGIFLFAVISTNISDYRLEKLFTEEEKQYMYNYINENYGNGEKIHIVSQENTYISDSKGKKRTGIKSTIIGYFDSQENAYLKYNKNSDKYSNGQIEHLFTINNSDYKKEDLSGYKSN